MESIEPKACCLSNPCTARDINPCLIKETHTLARHAYLNSSLIFTVSQRSEEVLEGPIP